MCVAVCYYFKERLVITHFAQEAALLPIKRANGLITLFPWGRRKKEPGELPLGGWISQAHLQQGKWDHYFPKPVKLPILKFMEMDIEGQGSWFDITVGNWISGIYLQEKDERRVYIVTITPEVVDMSYPRWPSVVCKL